MNNNTLYKKCLQALRSLNLEDLLDEPFLETVKTNLSEIIAEPDDSSRITEQILHIMFLRLSEQFKPLIQADNSKQYSNRLQLI